MALSSRALARALRSGALATSSRSMRMRGGGGGGLVPPMVQRDPIQEKAPRSQLHEHHDFIWNDGSAPESSLDYDAQDLDTATASKYWLGGLGFYFVLAFFAYLSKPEQRRRALPRAYPYEGLAVELGRQGAASEDE